MKKIKFKPIKIKYLDDNNKIKYLTLTDKAKFDFELNIEVNYNPTPKECQINNDFYGTDIFKPRIAGQSGTIKLKDKTFPLIQYKNGLVTKTS